MPTTTTKTTTDFLSQAREIISLLALVGTLRANTPRMYMSRTDSDLYGRLQQKLLDQAREQAQALLGEEDEDQ